MAVTIHRGKQGAHDFLKQHKVGVLATVDPNAEPHAAAIYYDVDAALTICFLTKSHTKKSDNLQHNNHAVLVVYDAESQTTVQVTGTTTQITDASELNKVFVKIIYASIDASNTSIPPIAKLKEGDYVAYRLTPVQIHMAVFSRPESGNYSELFKTIVPE